MADLAFVFGWAPADMDPMEPDELRDWRDRAKARYAPPRNKGA
jgi:hypothetical protein